MSTDEILQGFRSARDQIQVWPTDLYAWTTSQDAVTAYRFDPARIHQTPYVWMMFKIREKFQEVPSVSTQEDSSLGRQD